MKRGNVQKLSFLFGAGTLFLAALGIVPACHLVNGIDDFSIDPGLDKSSQSPCLTASECPGTDTECGLRLCEANLCGMNLSPKGTAVLEQIVGDCKVNQCDGAGNRVDGIVDPSDIADDGQECTMDTCSATGESKHEPLAAGTKCAMGTMVCDGKGACVECASDTDCTMDRVCAMNHCVIKTCINQMKDGQESDTDCGGPDCQPCATGSKCTTGADCQSNLCNNGICTEPSCSDNQKNGLETDTDCGGNCDPCADGSTCTTGADCTSEVCKMNVCQAPACDDTVQNGDEVHVDCGGSCGGCAEGSTCTANADCASEFCLSGLCAKIAQVATGTTHACAVVETTVTKGQVYCWGGNNYGELGIGAMGTAQTRPQAPVKLDNVTSVSTFSNTVMESPGGHTCARYEPMSGTVKFACWGRNVNGELGNGSQASSILPVDIAFGAGIVPVQIVAGGRHTCVITSNMHVQCWGANGNGQCGIGMQNSMITKPQSVAGASPLGAVQLALGTIHTCARLTTGELSCWGSNGHGQLGFNATTQTSPKKLTTIASVSQVAAGQDFTCAVTNSKVFCWGDDSDKQFGAGTQVSPITPLTVQSIPPVQALPLTLGAAGIGATPDNSGGHTCFLVANGKLICLGLNDRGQVGTGDTVSPAEPIGVNIDPVKQVSLGTQFTCAILEKGPLRCWGRNDLGQLGRGDKADSSIPVPVLWPNP